MGVDGLYNMVPFSIANGDLRYFLNSIVFVLSLMYTTSMHNNELSVYCDETLGDFQFGTLQYCCYISSNNGFAQATWNGKATSEGALNFINYTDPIVANKQNQYAVRMGLEGNFLYRMFSRAPTTCDYHFMGNFAIREGQSKSCKFTNTSLSVLSLPPNVTRGWTKCGDHDGTCTGLTTNEPFL